MARPVLWSQPRAGCRHFSRKQQVREALGEARAALEGTLGLAMPTALPLAERLRRWFSCRAAAGATRIRRVRRARRTRRMPYRHLVTLVVIVLLGATVLGQGFGIHGPGVTGASQGEGGIPLLVRGQDLGPVEGAFDFAAAPMSVMRRNLTVEESPAAAESPPATAGSIAGLGRSDIVTYTVQAGDTLDAIAAQFEVAAYTIFWINGLHAPVELRAGMVLMIPPISGVPHTVREGETIESIADKYGVRAGNIVGYPPNGLKYPYQLRAGQEIFVPGGTIEIPSYWVGEGNRPPPKILKMPGGEKLRWPTWGELTAPFGYTRAYGRYHHGIDIANNWGTPIYAAAAGTVVTSGWDQLGWHVIIDHHNGFRTVYGHMAERPWVAVGDHVAKGQRIGSMGQTYGAGGYATGVHLHFAVLHHGVYIDPLPLLEN